MRFDLHLREDFKTQVSDITAQMKEWETVPRIDESEQESVRDRIQPFDHTTHVDRLMIAGVDGSGDYPSVTYSDSFVYVTVAHGTVYESNTATGLKELPPVCKPLINVAWMSEQSEQRHDAWDKAFESLAGRSIEQSIERSDYQTLKAAASGRATSVSKLNDELLRPHAHDSGNVAIQLRSLGELGAALRLIESEQNLDFVLVDGTLSLPLVTRRDVSLFYEHVKRLCCVSASQRNIGFFAVSKSHGLPSIELIDRQIASRRARSAISRVKMINPRLSSNVFASTCLMLVFRPAILLEYRTPRLADQIDAMIQFACTRKSAWRSLRPAKSPDATTRPFST